MVGKPNLDRAHHTVAELEDELDDERTHSMADEGGFTAAGFERDEEKAEPAPEAALEEEETVTRAQVVRPPGLTAIPPSREPVASEPQQPKQPERFGRLGLTEPQLNIALIAIGGVALISILGWALERRARRYSEEIRDMAA